MQVWWDVFAVNVQILTHISVREMLSDSYQEWCWCSLSDIRQEQQWQPLGFDILEVYLPPPQKKAKKEKSLHPFLVFFHSMRWTSLIKSHMWQKACRLKTSAPHTRKVTWTVNPHIFSLLWYGTFLMGILCCCASCWWDVYMSPYYLAVCAQEGRKVPFWKEIKS